MTKDQGAETVNVALKKLISAQSSSFQSYLYAVDEFNATAIQPVSEAVGSELHAMALLLKLSNIAVGKYQFEHKHVQLVSKPFGLVVDPCNSCPLECPGCLHAGGAEYDDVDWSPGNLKHSTLEQLLSRFGPYGITTRLFNWGEPLLNKRTPEYVEAARAFFHRTSISSNLSVPFDAEALVSSGLDYLIMSVDGATQDTYERYRKKGDLTLVLENMRRLVAAKEKLGIKAPYLSWQYLLFEHTLPEIDSAIELAKDIGVDEINFTNPYDVSDVDPTIRLPERLPLARHVFNRPGPGVTESSQNIIEGLSPIIRDHYQQDWSNRYVGDQTAYSSETCQWLYKDIVMEASGRILPCCFFPKKHSILYFSGVDEPDPFNSKHFSEARSYFSKKKPTSYVGCHGCKSVNSLPNVNNSQLPFYFSFIDPRGFIDRESIRRLADW